LPDDDANAAGDFEYSVEVTYGNITCETFTTVLHVSPVDPATAKTLLVVGDSWCSDNSFNMRVDTLFSNSSNLTWIGTQDAGTITPNEGYGGSDYYDFEYNADGVTFDSPFINSDVNGTDIDFDYYLTENSFAQPDFIVFELGLNNRLNVEQELTACDSLVAEAIREWSGVEIGLCFVPELSNDPNLTANSGVDIATRKELIYEFNVALHNRYGIGGTLENAQVTLIPINIGFQHNMT